LATSELEEIRVFIKFESIDSARKAYADLNSRFFNGRKISAEFYNENKFYSKKYDL